LGFLAGSKQGGFVVVPVAEALEILRAAFIIQDEGHDFVAEAFFEHQESADTTVAILEGMDSFEAYMEIQDLKQVDLFQTFVLSQQRTQPRVDVFRRRSLGFSQSARLFPVLAGMDGILSDIDRSFREQLMEVFDIGLGQRLHGCLDDVVDAGEVVGRLRSSHRF